VALQKVGVDWSQPSPAAGFGAWNVGGMDRVHTG
jgi:hypothetical protein